MALRAGAKRELEIPSTYTRDLQMCRVAKQFNNEDDSLVRVT